MVNVIWFQFGSGFIFIYVCKGGRKVGMQRRESTHNSGMVSSTQMTRVLDSRVFHTQTLYTYIPGMVHNHLARTINRYKLHSNRTVSMNHDKVMKSEIRYSILFTLT